MDWCNSKWPCVRERHDRRKCMCEGGRDMAGVNICVKGRDTTGVNVCVREGETWPV